ncbi:ATP-binding cassette domain-containing protein [Vibrio sp. JC009]|uniref:ABC transporter ATP-binding protein n=1 Tax=Vibrio sp. JC009 TaxID=2912314 RepID=UPI0023AFAF78|nr:ATP-binding cassette domain-containing protein [Vibrio sp. JC009]WED23844.1 ATP-binding cassette domain-containing protein [Vibrio sp. JC009]
MTNSNKLSITGLSHAFDKKLVLSDINLNLNCGQVVAIVGRSGCGKSTLLNLVAGLIDVETGSIENGFSTTSILFQDTRLLPWKNTLDNIGWGMKAKGVTRKQRDKVAAELAQEVGLVEEDLDKFPHELSGGMCQRVAIARSLAVKPELLLLDEPFSALDIGLKEELYTLLCDEIERRSLTVLFITHDLNEAVRLADQIVVLSDNPGRQVYTCHCDVPRACRDQDYLYSTTMQLLKEDRVKQAFQTEGKNEYGR